MAAPRLLSISRLLATTTTKSSAFATTFISRSLTTTSSAASAASVVPRFSLLRSLAAVRLSPAAVLQSSSRTFATRQAQNSLNDNSPNWSNRPPKETILLDGCDFEHWLIVTDNPPEDWTRDQIIDFYIKTLAQVVGSEDEARMKIYSVSTRCYYAFGALISEELSYKLKDMEKIRWVLPDSYLDVRNKDYGGEPFIDGQAVPYDPKYHEEWLRNSQKAKERNSRSDRPRNADRSRNFERRQRTQGPPGGNMGGAPNQSGGAPNNPGFGQNMPPNNTGYGQPPRNPGYQQNMPPNNAGYQQNMPPNNAGYQQNMPPSNAGYQQNMPPNNAGYQQNIPQNNQGFAQNMPPSNFGAHGNPGYSNAAPNQGGMPYQNNAQMGGQQNYNPGGYQSQNVPGRDGPQ